MSSGGTEIARAYVTIIPKSDGTSDSVVRSVVDPLAKGGNDAGKQAGAAFSSSFGTGIAAAGKAFAAIGIGAAVTGFAKDSVEAGMKFDASMSQVAATMGTTADKIGDLREFAQEMGRTTKFSASESADALNYMALAGYDAQTSMNMLPNVLNLAAAGNMDLARASDMVTDAQSALGLSLDETTALVDKMAAASSKTNTGIGQLGEALLTVGGTAKTLTGGTTEAAQALGLLADNGIKGSEGGTALRNVLLGLSSKKFSETFGEMGVAAYDAEGKMRSLKDIFGDMNSAMEGMTVEEKTKLISSAFNKVDLKSVNALLGTNAERWDEVADAIDGSAGAAQKMAGEQMNNLQGDMSTFNSAMEGLQIAFSDMLTPALRGFVQAGTGGLGALTGALGGVKEMIGQFAGGFAEVFDADGLAAALGEMGAAVSEAFGGGKQADVQSFGQLVGSVVNGLIPIVQGMTPVVAAAAEAAVTYGNFLVEKFNTAVSFVKTVVIPVASEVFNAVAPVAQEIASTVGSVISEISSAWNEAMTAVFGKTREGFPGMADTIRGAMNAVKAVVGPTWNAVKTVVSTVCGAVRSAVQTAWPAISGAVRTAAGAIKAAISGISSVVGGVRSTFNSLKNAMANPIESARTLIKGAIDKIKSVFSGLHLDIPKPRIPHISVSGGSAPFGIGGKGSLPHFDVQWYAKGAIFTRPTILGNAVGVGEKGPEAILPVSELPDLLGIDGSGDSRPNVYVGDIRVAPESELYALLMELGERMVEDRRRGGKAVA